MRWPFDVLFGNLPAEFESHFGLEESVNRLSSATRRYVVFATTRVAIGSVSKDSVSLRRALTFGTHFSGEFREQNGRVVLSGRFALHWYMKGLMTFFLGFALLWTITAALAVLLRDPQLWWFPLFGLVQLAFGLTYLWLVRRFAYSEMAFLAGVIRGALSR